jgi:hypothetical protein
MATGLPRDLVWERTSLSMCSVNAVQVEEMTKIRFFEGFPHAVYVVD